MKKVAVAAVVLRLFLGWYMLIDGLQILMTPGWSAKSFLLSAKTFPHFYAWFALPMNSWWVDPLNSWGIVLIGIAYLLGAGVGLASWAGALMMVLYYFPHYAFPIVPHGYVIEDHLIYAACFALLGLLPASRAFGLSAFLKRTPLGRVPFLRALL